MVPMDASGVDRDAFEAREQMLNMRAKVLEAEEERVNRAKTMSVAEARQQLRALANEV